MRPPVRAVGVEAGLLAGYAVSILSTNWTSARRPNPRLLTLQVPAGSWGAGLTLTLRDLVHDVLGSRAVVLAAILVGTGVFWLVASPRVAGASAVIFATSECVDLAVHAALTNRAHLVAGAGSNAARLVEDSVVFMPLAFGALAGHPASGALTLVTATSPAPSPAARGASRFFPAFCWAPRARLGHCLLGGTSSS